MQHNGEVFRNDLSAVETTVKQYFDIQSPNTQAWLKDVADLKALDIRMVSDDALKASQTAVRNYQNNVRTAAPVFLPETKPEPASVPAASVVAEEPRPTEPAPVQAASGPASAPAASAASQADKGE